MVSAPAGTCTCKSAGGAGAAAGAPYQLAIVYTVESVSTRLMCRGQAAVVEVLADS